MRLAGEVNPTGNASQTKGPAVERCTCFGRSDGAQVGRLRLGVIAVFAHTRTLKALIVRRRFGNRSVSTGNMPVFLFVMYVE